MLPFPLFISSHPVFSFAFWFLFWPLPNFGPRGNFPFSETGEPVAAFHSPFFTDGQRPKKRENVGLRRSLLEIAANDALSHGVYVAQDQLYFKTFGGKFEFWKTTMHRVLSSLQRWRLTLPINARFQVTK